MPSRYHFQIIFILYICKIAEHKGNAFLMRCLIKKLDRFFHIGALTCWLCTQQLSYNVQRMLPPFFGCNVFFYLITEENGSYFIIVADSAESQYCANLGDHICFSLLYCSKQIARTNIYHQKNT